MKELHANPLEDLHLDDYDERLDLVSAYIDGEVSAEERRQVEMWLDTDAELRQEYQNMRLMQTKFQSSPVPQPIAAADISERVFAKIDRRRRRRWLSGGAVAAGIAASCALMTGVFRGERDFVPSFANTQPTPISVALNEPLIPEDDENTNGNTDPSTEKPTEGLKEEDFKFF